jgi:hypothetical protein
VHKVSDASSARYGRYLTPAQFTGRYAPSASTVLGSPNGLSFLAGLAPHSRLIPSVRH